MSESDRIKEPDEIRMERGWRLRSRLIYKMGEMDSCQ